VRAFAGVIRILAYIKKIGFLMVIDNYKDTLLLKMNLTIYVSRQNAKNMQSLFSLYAQSLVTHLKFTVEFLLIFVLVVSV
jgi:hypothetical protein